MKVVRTHHFCNGDTLAFASTDATYIVVADFGLQSMSQPIGRGKQVDLLSDIGLLGLPGSAGTGSARLDGELQGLSDSEMGKMSVNYASQ